VVHGPDESRLAQARELAVAEALVSIGQALTLLGSRLSELHAPAAHRETAAAEAPAVAGVAVPRGGLGPRQLAVLGLGGLSAPTGMSAGDVVTATGLKRPNVYAVLERLTELGYLEPVPDEQPARWRRTQRVAG
jgi:IclR helix-turn-helix domain